MRVFYAARYRIDIGPHVFPTEKYGLVVARLLDAGTIQPSQIIEPDIATWDDLALVHTAEYLGKLRDGTDQTSRSSSCRGPARWSTPFD